MLFRSLSRRDQDLRSALIPKAPLNEPPPPVASRLATKVRRVRQRARRRAALVLQPLLPRVATDADYSNGTVSSVLGTGICGKCGTSGEYIPFVVSQPRQKDASFKLTPTRLRRRRLCDQAPKVQQVPHCAVLFCRLSCARTLLYASAASLSAAGG